MKLIKIHRKERIVVDETFETSDGKIFETINEAEHHQLMLDGKRIVCPSCRGAKGKQVDRGEWGYYEAWEFVECPKCGGRGYLDLKFA